MRGAAHLQHAAAPADAVGLLHAGADDVVPPLWMEGPESTDRGRFHVVRIDLALHQIHPIPGAADYEVDFAVRLVAPVEDPLVAEPDAQRVQDEMLPQQSAVVVADAVPTLLEGDDLRVAASVEDPVASTRSPG